MSYFTHSQFNTKRNVNTKWKLSTKQIQMRKKYFSKGLHQAMLVQYTAVKTIELVFSDLKVLSWRQAIKCEGVFLTRKNPLSPQSTAWRQTLSNIVLNGQPWVTMTTASGKVSTVPLREKNVVQGQTRRLWRSQILFLSQSCHWTAAKIWASLGQMSLPASFRGSHQDCPCLFFLS